ncbi:sigma 54-interacting transcriptional regulator [Paradesulfitobacterium aromaticivorans]
MREKVYYLSKLDFFADLNTQELIELAEDFFWQEYAAGSVIIEQGQEKHSFYVLAQGKAETVIEKAGRISWQVSWFEDGDAFGEISLFTGKPAPAGVRAVENCRVLALDSEGFSRMLVRWPKLYPKFIEVLSQSLNKANHVLWDTKHKEFLLSALQLTHYEEKFYGIWGSVKTTSEVENKLNELAQSGDNLLLIGERGTGRQMLAWYLHKMRCGEAAPFVVVDGRNFDRQWGDSVLDAGDGSAAAFRGSSLLEAAQGGSVLIREVNLISPRAQLKLAHSLRMQAKKCLVVATVQTEPDLLTSKLIPELKECFLSTYKISPLRERKRDIPVIAQGVLEKLARKHQRPAPVLDQEATKLLLSHNYRQGNVTELIQVIERSFFLAENNVIGLEHIFFGPTAEKIGSSINLLSWDWISDLFKKGRLVNSLRIITSGIFVGIVLLLLFLSKTTVVTKVFIAVWGLWWPALAIISPIIGRVWCTVCPFSYIMDLAQRKMHLNKPVPDFLKKYDYILVTFLFTLIFWIEIMSGMRSNPWYTALLLLSIQLAAILTGVIFTRHAWCHHLCPLGGFVGTASIGAMLEVRADATVCLNKCTTHECYVGTGEIAGCPMSQHLPYLDNNLSCKLCFNCVRNCPNGAVQLNLRVPAREVWHLVRVNQGYAIFIAVVLAILIPLNYFEPLIGVWPPEQWRAAFSLSYWGAALAAGVFTWLIAEPFKKKAATRRVKLVFAFIPLVLAGHIVYQLHFVPGATSLMLGVGLKNSLGITQAVYIPAYQVGQALAVGIGALLTVVTVVLVVLRAKERERGKLKGDDQNIGGKTAGTALKTEM